MTNSGAGGAAGDPPLVTIVDDDESVRKSTCRLIPSFGYRAEAFGSGPEFLSSPAAKQTACLVLDVRMPGVDVSSAARVTAEASTSDRFHQRPGERRRGAPPDRQARSISCAAGRQGDAPAAAARDRFPEEALIYRRRCMKRRQVPHP